MLSLHETIHSWRTRPALLLSRSFSILPSPIFFSIFFFFLISGFHAKPFLTTSLIPLMRYPSAPGSTDDFIIPFSARNSVHPWFRCIVWTVRIILTQHRSTRHSASCFLQKWSHEQRGRNKTLWEGQHNSSRPRSRKSEIEKIFGGLQAPKPPSVFELITIHQIPIRDKWW